MSIYEHDIDTDPNHPVNQIGLDIVKCECRSCNYPVDLDSELKNCPSCGDRLVYIENDGREFIFDGWKYEVFE